MRNTNVMVADNGGSPSSKQKGDFVRGATSGVRVKHPLNGETGGPSPIYAKPKKPSGGGSAPAPTQNRKGSPSTKPSIPRNPTRPSKGGFSGGSASEGRMRGV